ncbi:MAG: septal ring lytic transglycosylase RlpA family protein [Terricaulis sp.]
MQRLVVMSFSLLFAGVAAADPAPIAYAARQEAPASQRAAASGNDLLGGDERSYGYGASMRGEGVPIDLRQSGAPAAATADAPASAVPAWLEQERVGPPYEANGRWYVPTPEPGYAETGQASWYGPQFNGQRAANGEIFDQDALTAAHPTLPLNSMVQVTNLENGREAIVRVTDRGPFVGQRLIDLSHGAAAALGFDGAGGARVHVRYLGPAPRRVQTAAEQPEQGPVSSALPQAAPAPLSLAPPAAPVALAGYMVQVGAFSDYQNAERARQAAAASGPVTIDTRQSGGAILHRVRVGPFASREEAVTAQLALADLGFHSAAITQR